MTAPTETRADPFQLALRFGIVIGTVSMLAVTRAAGSAPRPAVEVALVLLAAVSAVNPDGHVGLGLLGGLVTNWVVAVDDPTTPWAILAAASTASIHATAAAASVAPIGARWTRSMVRRWASRVAVAGSVCVPTWLVVAAVAELGPGTSPGLVLAALLLVALAGLWARQPSKR